MPSGLELYPHNEKAYRKLLDMLSGTRRACIIHPTGTGKAWETKDGQKRSRLTVVVDTIDFMSQGNQSQNASANRPAAQTQQTPVVPDVPAVMDVYDEDIPF